MECPIKVYFQGKKKKKVWIRKIVAIMRSGFSRFNPEDYFKQKSSTLELDFACLDLS